MACVATGYAPLVLRTPGAAASRRADSHLLVDRLLRPNLAPRGHAVRTRRVRATNPHGRAEFKALRNLRPRKLKGGSDGVHRRVVACAAQLESSATGDRDARDLGSTEPDLHVVSSDSVCGQSVDRRGRRTGSPSLRPRRRRHLTNTG